MIKAPAGEKMVSGKIELTWGNKRGGPPSKEEIKEAQEYYKECESSVKYHLCPFLNMRIKDRARSKGK